MNVGRRTYLTGKSALLSLIVGGALALAAHLVDGGLFTWWFVPAGGIAGFFAAGAYVRRHIWLERSACTAVAAVALAMPFVGKSVWFLICSLLLVAHYWLLTVEQLKRRHRR